MTNERHIKIDPSYGDNWDKIWHDAYCDSGHWHDAYCDEYKNNGQCKSGHWHDAYCDPGYWHDGYWENTYNYVKISDDKWATVSLAKNSYSKPIEATNFGFTIPSIARILGIEVEVEKHQGTDNNAIKDWSVKIIKNGSRDGSDENRSDDFWSHPSDSISTYGGSNDLWGLEWTPANINASNFGVAISARNVETSGGKRTAHVDNIKITVYYALPDTTSPVLREVAAVSSPTNDNTPSYTFNSDEAGTISYDGDCSSIATAAASGDNTITFSALVDGEHSNCTITVTDAANNASTPLSVSSFVVDTVAPVINAHEDVAVGNDPGDPGALVSYGLPSVTDNLDPAIAVDCDPSNGAFFSIGETTVNCNATDWAGNSAIPTSFKVAVNDTEAPVVTLNGSNPMIIQVNHSYDEPGAIVEDNYDSELTVNITGTVDVNTVGIYTVNYDAADSAGNNAIQVQRTVEIVDTEEPTTNDDVPAAWQNSDTAITFSCTDNVMPCAKVYYTTDGNDPTLESTFVNADNSWQFVVSGEGQYTIKYFGVDASDNQEAIKTAANLLKIDTTSPSAPNLSAPENGSEFNYDPTLSWGTSGDCQSGLKDYLVGIFSSESVDDLIYGPYEEVTTLFDTSDIGDGDLNDGTYFWGIKARDNAGNESSWSEIRYFIKDTAEPAVSIFTPLKGYYNSPITISGSSTDAISADPPRDTYTIKYVHLYHQNGDVPTTEIDIDPVVTGTQAIENLSLIHI